MSELTKQTLIRESYKQWFEWIYEPMCDGKVTETIEELRLIFLAEEVFGVTSYDTNHSIRIGKMIIGAMENIINRTVFSYTEDDESDFSYTLASNWLAPCITWGTSVRGAWFDFHEGYLPMHHSLSNVEQYDGPEDRIPLDPEFVEWFIGFIRNTKE